MTIILRDGFDLDNGLNVTTGLYNRWTGAAGAASLVAGRFGGQALNPLSASSAGVQRALPAPASIGSIRHGARITNLGGRLGGGYGGGNICDIQLMQGGGFQLGFRFIDTGAMETWRITGLGSAVLLATSPPSLVSANVWFDSEISFEISDTVGRVTLRVNGALVYSSATNLDTKNTATANVDAIRFVVGSNALAPLQVDDLVIEDTFTTPTDLLRIETLIVTSDGTNVGFTPSAGGTAFGVLDEVPMNDTDFISGSNVNDHVRLGLADLSSTPLVIREVNVVSLMQKTDVAARAIALGVQSGATNSLGADNFLAVGFGRFSRPITVDPNTGIAWTPAAVNALELDPKITV